MSELLCIGGCLAIASLAFYHHHAVKSAYYEGRLDELDYQETLQAEYARHDYKLGYRRGRQSMQYPTIFERN